MAKLLGAKLTQLDLAEQVVILCCEHKTTINKKSVNYDRLFVMDRAQI